MPRRVLLPLAPLIASSLLPLACGGEVHPRPEAPRPLAVAPKPEPIFVPEPPAEPPKPKCEPINPVESIVTVPTDRPVPEIVDDSGLALSRWHRRLAELTRGKAKDHLRIGMYGDSNMTMDFITGEMRRVFQKKFGDAGHGFVAAAKPWNWYRHMDVKHGFWTESWEAFAISTHYATDGYHGFAGIAAQSLHKGAVSWVQTADASAPIGKSFSSIDVYFLKRPKNGTFAVKVDGETKATLDTEAPVAEAAFERIEVPDGPHKVALVATSNKVVRIFGMALERATPSIQVDSLGVGALNIMQLATRNEPKVTVATLARRNYDLVIFLTGTNEWFPPEKHKEWMKKVIAMHRQATPDVSILVMAPPDHTTSFQYHKTDPRIVRVGKEKREIAAENQCAFWDFREAMGGDGAIIEFSRKKWAWTDLIHLTEPGGFYMGDRVAFALWREFRQWADKHPDAGCDPG